MKKRLLSMLAAVAMVLTLLPVSVFAEGEETVTPVAQIVGGASYESLEAAFSAAETGATIKLLSDTDKLLTEGSDAKTLVVNNKELTLDLNGKTLTHNEGRTVSRMFSVGLNATDDSKLTIKSSSSGGEIISNGLIMMSLVAGTEGNTAELVFESGTYTANGKNVDTMFVALAGTANAPTTAAVLFTLGENAIINIPYDRADANDMADWAGYAIGVRGIAGNANTASGVVANIYGTINAKHNGGFYVHGNIKNQTGNVPQINIGSTANITGISYLAGYAETTVESGASITGYNAIGIKSGKLTIEGGTIHGTGDAYVPTPGYSNGIYGSGAGIQIESHAGYAGNIELNINSGTIKSDNAPAVYEYNNVSGDANTSLGVFDIAGGNFAGNKTYGDIYTSNSAKAKAAITGGNYVCDPTAYLDADHVALTSTVSGYNFTVSEKTETAAEVAEGAPVVQAETTDTGATELVTAITEGTVSTGGAITAVASGLAQNNKTEANGDDIDALNVILDEEVTAANVVIVYEPYVDIKLTGINLAATQTETIVELDISAYYNVLATTETILSNVDNTPLAFGANTGNNAVKINDEPIKMEVKTPVPVTLPISEAVYKAISNSTVFVRHTKDDGRQFVYEARVSAVEGDGGAVSYSLTFVSLNGFSKIELFADSSKAIIQFDTTEDLGFANNTKTYNVSHIGAALPKVTAPSGYVFSGWKFVDAQNPNAVYSTLTKALYDELCEAADGEEAVAIIATPVFTERSYGSGSSTTNYTITIKTGEDGIVSPADKATVKEGNDLTIKITPNDGYVVDEIIVDGKSVGAAKTYTFKNVQENHTIEVTFKLAMTDVTPGGWPYDEIKYVIDSGLMDGIGGDEFAPDSTVTRAMLVTVLWRLEKQPANNGENPFTDLTQDWYKDAVIWAAENDIVNGYGDGRFGPSDILTREQMVTIIYRYANYVDIDVSGENDLSAFDDAESVNEYAENAMQWAVESGLIKGRAPTKLAPQGSSTRAELATVIMRFIENILK